MSIKTFTRAELKNLVPKVVSLRPLSAYQIADRIDMETTRAGGGITNNFGILLDVLGDLKTAHQLETAVAKRVEGNGLVYPNTY